MQLFHLTPLQYRILFILTLLHFLNYVDRQIVYALVPLLRAEFVLTRFEIGLLGTVFSLVHSLFTLPLGWLADRTSRKKVITFAVFTWSVATFLCGLAQSFRSLLQFRALVGVGEAAYAPSAMAILTGSFSPALRARVQGFFECGMFIGGAVGLGLGSILAQWLGWRAAFFVVGIPGLLVALSIFRLPEPRAEKEKPFPPTRLLRIPAYVAVLVGGWFITFAAHSYIFWGTDFVYSHKNFELWEAGLLLGVSLVVAGVIGIGTGAALGDRLARRFVWGRAFVIGLGLLIGAPLLLAAIHTESKALFVALFFVACVFMSWYHGPLTAVMHDLTPAHSHATALGLYFLFVNLFAVTPSPLLLGGIADRYGLHRGMELAVLAQTIGGLCFLLVAYIIHKRHSLPAGVADASPAS
jgi:MFS family permease